MNFATSVGVARLEDKLGGAITSFNLEIRIHCADCGQKLQFPRLEPDMDREGAHCSLDSLEAGIATSPKDCAPIRQDGCDKASGVKYTPCLLMPKKAARIKLEITGVPVERLQGIS